MRKDLSKNDEAKVSILQELPLDLAIYLLAFLSEQDKYALWRSCHHLKTLTDGQFLRPLNPFHEYEYNDDSGSEIASITVKRYQQKCKLSHFQLLTEDLLLVAYPHGIVDLHSLSRGSIIDSSNNLDGIDQLLVLSESLFLCQKADQSLSLFRMSGNHQLSEPLTLNIKLPKLISAIQISPNEAALTTDSTVYTLNLTDQSLSVRFQSDEQIINTCKNIDHRLVISTGQGANVQHHILDLKSDQVKSRIRAKNINDYSMLGDMIATKLNPSGDCIRFYKSRATKSLTTDYSSEQYLKNDNSVTPAITERMDDDVRLLNNAQLLFIRKEENDKLELTVTEYPKLDNLVY